MKIIEAAHLMDQAYNDKAALQADKSISLKGMEAHFVRAKRVLIIEGTNSLDDWWRYNFDLFANPKTVDGDNKRKDGEPSAYYHEGFYNHAMRAFAFAKAYWNEIDFVIGHSLGAASAQIAGPSLGKRTVAFASPKPLLRGDPLAPELVTNICREDDLICRLPPGIFGGAIGFGHIGEVEWLTPATRHPGEDHRIDKYIDILKNEHKSVGDRDIVPF